MPLVQMKATGLNDDRHTLERSRYQLPFVARHAGLGKTRNLGIGNTDWGSNFVGEKTETGTEDYRDTRLQCSQSLLDYLRRLLYDPNP